MDADDIRRDVPCTVHERDMARMERANRRLALALAVESIVLVVVFLLCMHTLRENNRQWIEAWTSYDYTSEEVNVDSGDTGSLRYIGDGSSYYEGSGGIYYGTSDGQEKAQD